ncbi:MAG TPA: tyrosinase family protein [Caulobacteraceae bacterium]
MAVRVRKSVYALPAGDTTLDWYNKAVKELLSRPIANPTSWRYMAGVHGARSSVTRPTGASTYWDKCQHSCWYFFPWHRGYITAFEAVVADCVAKLGGPSDWALPYWNYSEDTTANPSARSLPPAFVGKTLADGSQNYLSSIRNATINLTDAIVSLNALKVKAFGGPPGGGAAGFGGPKTGPNHPIGGTSGALEDTPHNVVHDAIGGLMADPDTSPLDPIFWLHHCNIDRLWEVWRNQGPPAGWKDATWLAQTFDFHDAAGNPITFACSALLDTTKIMHGYSYDSTPVATAMISDPTQSSPSDSQPTQTAELAGANAETISLVSDPVTTTITLALDRTTMSFSDAAKTKPSNVFLNLENMTGSGVQGNIQVSVAPAASGADPLVVGVAGTFGIAQASDPQGDHGGSGMTVAMDITDFADQIGLSDGSATQVSVTLQPQPQPEVDSSAPDELADVTFDPGSPSIGIGRVSLFFASDPDTAAPTSTPPADPSTLIA